MMTDQTELARHSVGKAIRSARSHMLSRHRLLGSHLQKYIDLGYECLYRPPLAGKNAAVGT